MHKRHTAIHVQAQSEAPRGPAQAHRDNAWKDKESEASPVGNQVASSRNNVAVRGLAHFRRPTHFRIVPHGSLKLSGVWKSYKKTYKLRLGTEFWWTSAQQMTSPFNEVLVQELPETFTTDEVQKLQELRHTNIHTLLDVFLGNQRLHAVFEHMELSLHEVTLIGVNLTELTAIIGQILNGLTYLAQQKLDHGTLTCSNILISRQGIVKIGRCEYCRPRTLEGAGSIDVRMLQNIAVQLMGGYINQKGAACLPKLDPWSPAAVDFLADTEFAVSAHQLQNHALLKLPWNPGQLKSVVSRAIRMVRINISNIIP